jgi:ribosomal protein L4
LAKNTAILAKAIAHEVIAVEDLSKVTKTKIAGELIKKLLVEYKSKRFTFVLSEKNHKLNQFLRNLENVNNVNYKEASALDIFKGGTVILDQDIFEVAKPIKKSKGKENA